MAGDDVIIIIRADNGQAIRAFRDVNGRLRDMRGRFVSEGSIMSRAMNQLSGSIGSLVPVATAAVPAAAALGVATLKAGGAAAGAGTALAAFGAAVAGQIGSLTEAADAQDKYNDAVFKYGQGSKQAAEAQRTVQATFESMPASTQRAAVALSTLKDGFQDWSDSVADFTMTPVEKSFTLLGQLVPRLTDMAKGASSQLDRLVTVAGGAMATPGFDALSDKLSTFANESLKDAVDGVIHFARALSEGTASGPLQSFIEYANANGPALRETLSNVGDAVMTLVEASAQAGPGMLTLVNAAAGLVASLPPELVATVMKLAVALKLVTLAGAGAAAISGGIATLGARIAALQAASAAAGGGLAGLGAAFATLGTAAKASIVVGGIALVAVALNQLSKIGKDAPPDIDRMTTSLGNLAQTGKLSGEAARVFGKDFDQLGESLRTLARPSNAENVQQFLTKLIGMDSTPVKNAKEDFDALDEGLTNLVKGGKADLAKAALGEAIKGLKEQGFTADEVRGQLDGYKSALADVAFEQELIAQSMGIFGETAQDTSAKLEAQKGAADGLRASILALNDVNRSAYEAQIGFEESLDSLTASFKEHGATLNLDTEAGRANGQAMADAAKAQDELIASGLAAGESLGSMTAKSNELRETMMRLAVDAFDGNKQKATEYVNTLLGVPGGIETLVRLEREEAIRGLGDVQAAIEATPGAKSITVDTLNGAAIAALEKVGLKTKQLPDGKTAVFTANGKALTNIGAVLAALNNLDGTTANTYTNHYTKNYVSTITKETFYKVPLLKKDGGLVSFYADGGVRNENHIAQIAPTGTTRVWNEPETGGEAYIPLARSKRPRSRIVAEETVSRLGGQVQWFAKGGLTKRQKAAQEQAKAEREARNAARGDLTVSRFGWWAGSRNSEVVSALGRPDSRQGLVDQLNQMRTLIQKSTHGGTESSLLRRLDSAGKALLGWEKKLSGVSKSLDKARDRLDSLKDAAAQLKDSVASGIVSGANITKAAGASDSRVTINTLLSQMTGSANNAKQFADMLKQLKSRGLDKGLMSEIAQAGVEGGGMETAAAILGGSSGQIKQLNKLRAHLMTQSRAAGDVAADAMYGAGIKAAEGLVKGLQSQQDKIEKQMLSIAKSMEKAIKKALGIRSPSKVMEEVGDFTAQGFADGILKNRSVQPAWASMLNEPRRAGRPVQAAAAGGDRPIVLNVSLGTQEFGQIWVDVGRQQVATRGGVKATLGRLE